MLARPSLSPALLVLSLLFASLMAGPADARELAHEVRPGQYLSLIARRYHTTAHAIQEQNELRKGQTLRPGMVLKIEETPAHRQWLAYLEKKKRTKEKATEKKREAEAAKKAAAERAAAARSAARKAAAKKAEERRAAAVKAAAKRAADRKRAAAEARASRRAAAREPAPNRAAKPKQTASKSSKRPVTPFSRRPRHAGRLRLVRHREVLQVQLVDDDGKLVEKNLTKVRRLLRSLRTGKKHDIDPRLLRNLAVVSDHFGGRTIIVVSGYRPPSPKQFTKNSRHNHGKAIDFKIVGVPHRVVFDRCRELGEVGCGLYPNSHFVHMDVRKHKTQWTDMSFPGQAPRYVRKKKKKKDRKVAQRKHSRKPSKSRH